MRPDAAGEGEDVPDLAPAGGAATVPAIGGRGGVEGTRRGASAQGVRTRPPIRSSFLADINPRNPSQRWHAEMAICARTEQQKDAPRRRRYSAVAGIRPAGYAPWKVPSHCFTIRTCRLARIRFRRLIGLRNS